MPIFPAIFQAKKSHNDLQQAIDHTAAIRRLSPSRGATQHIEGNDEAVKILRLLEKGVSDGLLTDSEVEVLWELCSRNYRPGTFLKPQNKCYSHAAAH